LALTKMLSRISGSYKSGRHADVTLEVWYIIIYMLIDNTVSEVTDRALAVSGIH